MALVNAENDRILEMIKAGKPSQVRANLSFLIETKLITDPELVASINDYYKERPSNDGPGTSFPNQTGANNLPISSLADWRRTNIALAKFFELIVKSRRNAVRGSKEFIQISEFLDVSMRIKREHALIGLGKTNLNEENQTLLDRIAVATKSANEKVRSASESDVSLNNLSELVDQLSQLVALFEEL